VHIDVVLWVVAKIAHRDEDTSYFDKEEQRYLIENYVTWRETHRIETNVIIDCTVDKVDDEYAILDSIIVDDRKFRTLDLDEDTMQSWDELETECHEEPDLVHCSECGKVMGYTAEYILIMMTILCVETVWLLMRKVIFVRLAAERFHTS